MKFLRWLEKRLFLRDWIPWALATTDQHPRRQSGNLAVVRRCLALYRDLILSAPLVCEKGGERVNHPLLDIFEKPAPWMTRTEFWTKAVQDYFLSGNFYCYIKAPEGRIDGLLPFPESSIYAYAKGGSTKPGGDSTDPLLLDRRGWYYQSQFKGDDGKELVHKFSSESIWHLKNLWQSGGDPLNGIAAYQQYPETFAAAQSLLDTFETQTGNGLMPPMIITGLTETAPDQKKAIRDELLKFFENGKGRFLTLPDDGIELKDALVPNAADVLIALSSISSMNIARIFSCPISLVNAESGNGETSGLGLKESHRFWLKTSGKAFLNMLSEKINELAEPGVSFRFLWRSAQFADVREAQILPALIEGQVITKQRAEEWLAD